jgi:hypothetical protein
MNSSDIICAKPDCGKEAKLQCPTCIKLEIKENSHFCNQVKNIRLFLTIMSH